MAAAGWLRVRLIIRPGLYWLGLAFFVIVFHQKKNKRKTILVALAWDGVDGKFSGGELHKTTQVEFLKLEVLS